MNYSTLDPQFVQCLNNLKQTELPAFEFLNGISDEQLSTNKNIDKILSDNTHSDISIDGTSNVDKIDVVTLLNEAHKPDFKITALNKHFMVMRNKFGLKDAQEWLFSEYTGKSYLHDSWSSSLIPYCYAYSLERLAKEGQYYVENFNYLPAKHLITFVDFIKEFVSWNCNRTAGAVGLPDVVVYLYYFYKKDVENNYMGCDSTKSLFEEPNLAYFKQNCQRFIYGVNAPAVRNSYQSAFTNVSIFDHEYAHALFDGRLFPDDTPVYEHVDEIVEIQKYLMEVIAYIRGNENMYTFPVLTYSLLTKEIDEDRGDGVKKKVFVDTEFAKWCSDHNCKWLDSNFFCDSSVTSLSNCCRLKSDISDMLHTRGGDLGNFNSIGSTALSVGSMKIDTVNLANIAYNTIESYNDEYWKYPELADRIERTEDGSPKSVESVIQYIEDYLMRQFRFQIDIALKLLDAVRTTIEKNGKKGLCPNIMKGNLELKNLYNTVGVVGLYEMVVSIHRFVMTLKNTCELELGDYEKFEELYGFIKIDEFSNVIYTQRAEKLVKRLFDEMREEFRLFKEKNNISYSINCEQIPAESAAYKLMVKDSLQYPNLVVDDLPVYSNQFYPLGVKTSLDERLRISKVFDDYLNGGSILHINVENTFTDTDDAWGFLNYCMNYGPSYFAVTGKISSCKNNHAFWGNICSTCGEEKASQFSRIVGFYTRVDSWGKQRKEEFNLRQWLDTDKYSKVMSDSLQ